MTVPPEGSPVGQGLVPCRVPARNDSLPQRKKIRLDAASYAHPGAICAVTTCTLARRPLFTASPLAGACVDVLRSEAARTEMAVHAYCVMPDHVHLLIAPQAATSIVAFVGAFKSQVARLARRQGVPGSLWQPRFYDRFLRRDDDLARAVEYVVENPVRCGPAADWREYPFCGSLVHDL